MVKADVDIVIPCYNYGRYLANCVQSVVSQEGIGVRILIIDDCSTDNTPEICRQLAAAHPEVEFRRHAVNRGHIATYNEGLIEWSQAPYSVLLSADDMLTPGSLRRAVSIMNADRNVGMVYGPTVHFQDETKLPKVAAGNFKHSRFTGFQWLNARCKAGHNVVTSPEVVVRGTLQRAVGGYRSELPHSGDLEMWLRIAAVSDIAFVRDIPQAFYRVHSSSMTRSRNNFVDIQQRRAAFDLFFRHHSHLPEFQRLQSSAYRALAREALWDACRAYDRNEVAEARASELAALALEIYPEGVSLPEYAALRRRRRLGAVWCHRSQVFIAPAVVRRIRRQIRNRNWKRNGV
jgi:glycosyltransferase involved in cell wall biosynthesis